MIKINLATRKQAAASGADASAGGTGLKLPGGLSKISFDVNQVKDLPIRQVLIPIVVAVGASFFLDSVKEEEMQKLAAISEKLVAERTQLANSAGKMKGYEATKKAMDADEQVLRIKLETIQHLITDRANPPKVLRSLATAIPKDVWMSEFQAGEQQVTFRGFSLDFNQVSDFMKNLNESAYFSDLNIRTAQQGKDETGLEVATFELTAKRRSQ